LQLQRRQGIIVLAHGTTTDHAMYLCLCNGLTETRVTRALAELRDPPRVSDAYRACGCTAVCGTCAEAMKEVVRAERARRASAGNDPLGAD
jgi:bacterioferritin-associated ferredoxin